MKKRQSQLQLPIIILIVLIIIVIVYIIYSCNCNNNNNNNLSSKISERFEDNIQSPNILALNDLKLGFYIKEFISNDNADNIKLNGNNNTGFTFNNKKINFISLNDLTHSDTYSLKRKQNNNIININDIDNKTEFNNLLKDNVVEYKAPEDDKGSNKHRPIRINGDISNTLPNRGEPLNYLIDNLKTVNKHLDKDGISLNEDEKFKQHDYFIAKRTGEKISEYRPFMCFYKYRNKFKGKKDYLKSETYNKYCNADDVTNKRDQDDITYARDYYSNQTLNFKLTKNKNNKGYQMQLYQINDDYIESYFYDLKNYRRIFRVTDNITFIKTMNDDAYLLKRINIPINKKLVLTTVNGQSIEIDKSTNNIDRTNNSLKQEGHPTICEISMDDINTSLRNANFFDDNKPKKTKSNPR